MKIVIAGATGFIGRHVAHHLRQQGHTLVLLSRKPQAGYVWWDPEHFLLDGQMLEGADVVINLCGEPIMGRWTRAKQERVRTSRLGTATVLVERIQCLKAPPSLYIATSAVGYYGDCGARVLEEQTPRGEGALAALCHDWEEVSKALAHTSVRVVTARLGVVLGAAGGMLPAVRRAVRWGMGTIIGSGEQYLSWIALPDVVRAFSFIIGHPHLSGVVNVVGPHPVTQRQFMQTLARYMHTRVFLRIPRWVVFALLGPGCELVLASQRVMPRCLLGNGFTFTCAHLEEALTAVLSKGEV